MLHVRRVYATGIVCALHACMLYIYCTYAAFMLRVCCACVSCMLHIYARGMSHVLHICCVYAACVLLGIMPVSCTIPAVCTLPVFWTHEAYVLHVCRMCFCMHCLQRVVLATGYCYAFDFLDEKALGMSFTNQRYLTSHPPIF